MAIDTTDKKYAVMDWGLPWEPGIVINETSPFVQADKQQLLWGYPGILWGAPPLVLRGSYIPTFRPRRNGR